MPAAVAIPLIVGAGSSVAGAAISAHAAGSAAKKQQDSANQALALNRDIYNQQVARTQPYVNAGYQSLNNLMQQFGSGQNFSQQVAAQLAPFQGAIGMHAQIPQGGYVPPQFQVPQYGPPSQANAGMVMMRAPNGEVAAVPPERVQDAIAKGATRVSVGGGLGGSSLAGLGGRMQ